MADFSQSYQHAASELFSLREDIQTLETPKLRDPVPTQERMSIWNQKGDKQVPSCLIVASGRKAFKADPRHVRTSRSPILAHLVASSLQPKCQEILCSFRGHGSLAEISAPEWESNKHARHGWDGNLLSTSARKAISNRCSRAS